MRGRNIGPMFSVLLSTPLLQSLEMPLIYVQFWTVAFLRLLPMDLLGHQHLGQHLEGQCLTRAMINITCQD